MLDVLICFFLMYFCHSFLSFLLHLSLYLFAFLAVCLSKAAYISLLLCSSLSVFVYTHRLLSLCQSIYLSFSLSFSLSVPACEDFYRSSFFLTCSSPSLCLDYYPFVNLPVCFLTFCFFFVSFCLSSSSFSPSFLSHHVIRSWFKAIPFSN